jgi:predicted metalloprotease with PDZ domain
MPMKDTIRYTIEAIDPAAHLFEVSISVDAPHPEGQVLSLPAWIPGSYMIREFSRNIVRIQAESAGVQLALRKLDKHTWKAAVCKGKLVVRYEVYAWDMSVRTAHLDQTHGFFNGTSVFLRAHGCEHLPHVLELRRPAGVAYKAWRVATSLPELKAKRYGFGTYVAADYDELIDHPVEMGSFVLGSFRVHGVSHDVVITGYVPNLDLERLLADLKKICAAQIVLFEPKTRCAPMQHYVFMTFAVGEGYGGLEHRASTALICARADLPVKGQAEMTDGYRTYLGLCSHEYFHTWNVKRIKPAAFAPYDLATEANTTLLWLFEGFTSYYDDLMLVRSGVIDEAAYFKLLAKNINSVLRGSGRTKQSVAESSFDAWTKYYRQDENAPNAIVSYYAKGALVALAMDLTLRAHSRGARSLDDVMRLLWQRYGRDFYSGNGKGISEAEAEAVFDEVAGIKLKRFFDRHVRGTADLPLARLLEPFAITWNDERKGAKPGLGVRTTRDGGGCKLANVYEGGVGHRAGLSAGDVLVALDQVRVTGTNLDALLTRYRVGDTVRLHAFRRDELMTFDATLAPDAAPEISLAAQSRPIAAVRLRAGWLASKSAEKTR